MQIEYTENLTLKTWQCDVKEYVSTSLSEYANGSVEQAEANAESAQEALGRLVNILCEKNILTAEDVVTIANSCDKEAKLISG